MRKTIHGLRYDTDAAVFLGRATNSLPGAPDYWQADLYRTRRAQRYFLAGTGGALSRFAQSAGQNTWGEGADLIPLTETEARAWADHFLDEGTVKKYFPERENA